MAPEDALEHEPAAEIRQCQRDITRQQEAQRLPPAPAKAVTPQQQGAKNAPRHDGQHGLVDEVLSEQILDEQKPRQQRQRQQDEAAEDRPEHGVLQGFHGRQCRQQA